MDFIYFLGRFHVLVLHLPIALALVVILAEWLSRKEKYAHLTAALPFLWAATAVTAVGTVVLGYLHFSEGGFTGPSAIAHRLLGTSIAVVSVLAWALRSVSVTTFNKAAAPICVALFLLVVLTGHYGGNLTHGDTYLVEYAPGPLRRLAGLEDARPPVTDLAMADPYLDIARPIFSQRCFSCHNDDKQRGGLNLANHAAVMKGGDDGVVVVAGDPDQSDLYRRITLAPDHEDAMPAEGKTPLTADQVTILKWWIASGAKTGSTLAAEEIPDDVRPLLQASLGLSGTAPVAAGAGDTGGDAAPQQADSALVAKLVSAGFMSRQETLSDPHLIVTALAPGRQYSAEQLATLESAAPVVLELNLQRSNLKDEALTSIGKLTALTRLRIDNNQLTDRGVGALAGLEQLTYLNLHGNKGITDASIDHLAKLPKLQNLYLWNTGVTPRGVARLKQLRPELQVDIGEEDFTKAADTAGVSPARRGG